MKLALAGILADTPLNLPMALKASMASSWRFCIKSQLGDSGMKKIAKINETEPVSVIVIINGNQSRLTTKKYKQTMPTVADSNDVKLTVTLLTCF